MKEILKNKIRKGWKWGICLILLAILSMGAYAASWELRPQVLEIYFFSLNKGRSIFIRTPHNQTILIDGGQNTDVIRELSKVFPFYRRRIDAIVITSSLPKNAGGLSEVVTRYDIGKIIKPTVMGTSTALYAFENSVKQKKLQIEKVGKGDGFEIDGVKFDILFPDPSFKFNKTNVPQLVLRLSYESTSAIFLGDISKIIQKTFLDEASTTNIAEYSHSAGDSRASPDLFSKLSPEYTVISKQNRATSATPPKKPPKKPPFNIENQKNTQIVNLVEKGTVHFILDGKTVRLN